MAKAFLLCLIIGLFLLIFWKVSAINADLQEKKNAIRMFNKKAGKVEEKEVDDLFESWKDQKEGIGK